LTSPKRILVASTSVGHNRAQQALSLLYDLSFASTMADAMRQLEEDPNGFDMVIAGVHFDESRMFELLQFIRTVEPFEKLPFLVMQAQESAMTVMEGIKNSADKLGACGFIELQNLPEHDANKLLQETVVECFGKPVKHQRMDKIG
jgi:PleD family two-component response regulator